MRHDIEAMEPHLTDHAVHPGAWNRLFWTKHNQTNISRYDMQGQQKAEEFTRPSVELHIPASRRKTSTRTLAHIARFQVRLMSSCAVLKQTFTKFWSGSGCQASKDQFSPNLQALNPTWYLVTQI